MSDHPLKALIESADRSISAKDFDGLMRFYTDDATLVVKAGMYAKGKDQIRKAFEAISAHFQGKLKVRQGRMEESRAETQRWSSWKPGWMPSTKAALRRRRYDVPPMCFVGTRLAPGYAL
ncbi:YybH family protein [Rhizobium lentis]|uniref:Uncharacterized protein n=1 Tax=Rhizobium lentis TaxID=1138194 RepID=A0A7W8XKS8_9HYPH|nr:hypothetical protein [Rhizobium lentis]MBB4577568.1 hypothetical protein [Rhizobium lentis]MBB5554125.1 hypothetical protein [Rhizobium lentis]MBB5564738.1 hypothetical protein [Rhizobium lentis]MBB5571245.1 hypothetical protein [Rhizobium lentis]